MQLFKPFWNWINSLLPPKIQQTSNTISNNISRAVTTLFEQFPQLKPHARVPKLQVRDPSTKKVKYYPLLHDKYVLGRDARVCDIVIANPIVSKEHLSIERRNSLPNKPFIIQDRNSKHGTYQGNQQIKRDFVLKHNDVLTLGQPVLKDAVVIKFIYPPPLHIQAATYSFYTIIAIPIFLLILTGLVWPFSPSVKSLPALSRLPVIIYASDQTPLYQPRNIFHQEAQKLSEFPAILPQAVIASEDSRFYWHQGVDLLGIMRAVLINIRNRNVSEGASTLTQQLARSLFSEVGKDQSIFRKVKEIGVALKLETVYSKDDILLNYLNNVYLGEGIYGFKDAAKVYFGKSVKEITLPETATLVAMLPKPNTFDLCRNRNSHKDSVERRNRVINRMQNQHKIEAEEARRAKRSPIQAAASFCQYVENRQVPYFSNYVFQELNFLLGEEIAQQGNFAIQTSLNLQMQNQAEKALTNLIKKEGITQSISQGAVTTIDPKTGRIIALVGGVNSQTSELNRVTQSQRQPGSTFKVFAYTAALEQNISPEKTYSCTKLKWDKELIDPCKYTNKDSLDMHDSLATSENVVAMRIAQEVGLNNVIATAKKMGIQSKLKDVPRLILGHSELNLLELTGAYAVLANDGVKVRPHIITKIFDTSECKNIKDWKTCQVKYSDESESKNPVLKREVARKMTELLTGVVRREDGTGNKANLSGVTVAGKTGTTNDARDLWFVGYIPQKLVTGVWLGNDDNTPTNGTSALAAQLWGEYTDNIRNQLR